MDNNLQGIDNQGEKISQNRVKLDRLQQIIRYKGFKNPSQLAKSLNISQGYFSEMMNNKKDIPKTLGQKLEDILNISRRWFETGEGVIDFEADQALDKLNDVMRDRLIKMSNIHSENDHPSALKEPVVNYKTTKGVPYYDVDFMGGYDLVFNDQNVKPEFYIDFLPFNDCDCWINVSGKSMGPLIAHGDIVALKKVDNWKRFLLEGEIYAIITDNGFRTIKMIGAGHDKDHYTLIPYNKGDEYKPQAIPKEVISQVFRVKGNIKKFF